MRAKIIGVFGSGNVTPAEAEWQAALAVGRGLAQKGIVVLTGGLGGIMTAANMGAKEAGGTTLGILPGTRETTPANKFVDIAVYSGMGEARNAINVKSCHAAIAIGGEYGTLSEIALGLKGNCPMILLDSWSMEPHGGLQHPDWQVAANAEHAVALAVQAAEKS